MAKTPFTQEIHWKSEFQDFKFYAIGSTPWSLIAIMLPNGPLYRGSPITQLLNFRYANRRYVNPLIADITPRVLHRQGSMSLLLRSSIAPIADIAIANLSSRILHAFGLSLPFQPFRWDFLKEPFRPFLEEMPPFAKDKDNLLSTITSSSEVHFSPFKL